MNKATAYTWIGAVIGGIVGLVVSMMFGGGMEILGTIMRFRWMEALNLTSVGAAVVVFVITIVAGAIVGRIIVNVAGYPNTKAIIGAIVAGSVTGMVLVSATVGGAIIGAIIGAIGGGIFAAIAGTRKDAIIRTVIGGAIASAAMLGGAILGSSENAVSGLIAGAVVGGAIGGAIGGIIISSIAGGAIGGAFSGIIFAFAIVGDAMIVSVIFACAVFGAIFGATAGLREAKWEKKYNVIIVLFFIYVFATILGSMSMGIISFHTDKKEYNPGEKVTISSRNSGIALLCGVPYWYVYKINDSSERLVYWNEVKGPQCKWPQGYFGVEGIPVVWDPSEVYTYTGLDVGPQKEGKYRVVVMVRTGGGFNSSDSTIITVK